MRPEYRLDYGIAKPNRFIEKSAAVVNSGGWMLYVALWFNGAAVGALVAAVYLWWSVATGRRTIRPWNEL